MLLITVVLSGSLVGCGPELGAADTDFYPQYLCPFAKDQFLATSWSETTAKSLAKGKEFAMLSAMLGEGPVFSDRLYCLDSSGDVQWSVGLDGYEVQTVSTSPETKTAAVLARRWVTDSTEEYRVLLVDANGPEPRVTVLREIAPPGSAPSDGFYAPQVSLARDGESIALYLTLAAIEAETSSLEVMDTTGNTLWKAPLPQSAYSFPPVAMDGSLSTAVYVSLDRADDSVPYVLVCRAPGEITSIDGATAGLRSDRVSGASISPDGKAIAVTSGSGSISLFTFDRDVTTEWTVRGHYGDVPYFSADGRMLVCETGSYDEVTGESMYGVDVLSVADGSVLWEEEHVSLDNEIWEAHMWHFEPGFIFNHYAGEPDEPYRFVDLTGEMPAASTISSNLRGPYLSYDGSVVLGIDGDYSVVPMPLH